MLVRRRTDINHDRYEYQTYFNVKAIFVKDK